MKRTNLCRHFLMILTLSLCVFGCDSGNGDSNTEENGADSEFNVPEANDELEITVHDACFTRYELCENDTCEYGEHCLCSTAGPTPQIPEWNYCNLTERSLEVVRAFSTITNELTGEETYIEYELGTTIDANTCFTSIALALCVEPADDGYAGINYSSSDIDYRNSSLKLTVVFLDEDGNEVGASDSGPFEVVEEEATEEE